MDANHEPKLPEGMTVEMAQQAVRIITGWWEVSDELDELELAADLFKLFRPATNEIGPAQPKLNEAK